MSLQIFTVQASQSLGYVILLPLLVSGIVMSIIGIAAGLRKSRSRTAVVLIAVTGLMLVGIGVGIFSVTDTPSQITIGTGYVSVQSSSFSAAGDINISATQIVKAFVTQIGSGNFSLTKQRGTDYGNLNLGLFTLGNGHSAYVISDNLTDLVLLLTNGMYLILGTRNTSSLENSFVQYVHPMTNSHLEISERTFQ